MSRKEGELEGGIAAELAYAKQQQRVMMRLGERERLGLGVTPPRSALTIVSSAVPRLGKLTKAETAPHRCFQRCFAHFFAPACAK